MTANVFNIHIPLNNFGSTEDRFELAPCLFINRLSERPDLHDWWERLGRYDQDYILGAAHWLTFKWEDGTEPTPSEELSLVLLALWLVKRTHTQPAYLFQLGPDAMSDGEFIRFLDRFHWVAGTANDKFSHAELASASLNYTQLRNIYANRGRLNDALLLTLAGCFAYSWQVALVSYAAATETLLTYSTAPGLTQRLATAYACLIETNMSERDAAFREFRALYTIRSDITHGRTHTVPIGDRLANLTGFEDLIRNLWKQVISSNTVISELEGSDKQREVYFKRLSTRYVAPKP